ncbi:hypothetical protein [Kribbella solani]|uniref:Uncharacterized protein n=1 Tax=Kribbella solani TaxID=236067 RepID=A0A841DMK4_9ACTN|nr:hypothetical protein [Kribbella solani]MBB5979121.1 hypothetical protein [Kribbella solani]
MPATTSHLLIPASLRPLPQHTTTPALLRPTYLTMPTYLTRSTSLTMPTYLTRSTSLTMPTYLTRSTSLTRRTYLTWSRGLTGSSRLSWSRGLPGGSSLPWDSAAGCLPWLRATSLRPSCLYLPSNPTTTLLLTTGLPRLRSAVRTTLLTTLPTPHRPSLLSLHRPSLLSR